MENAIVIKRLQEAFPGQITDVSEFRGQLSVRVPREAIVEVAGFLHEEADLGYNFLENLCGVDYLGRDPRFEVVYHFISLENRHRVCLKVGVPENDPTVPTLTGQWATANWHERETFDLMGIVFSGHPSLDRILLPEDWVGYPLRKDVPLGYEEVAFTINEQQINDRKPYAKE